MRSSVSEYALLARTLLFLIAAAIAAFATAPAHAIGLVAPKVAAPSGGIVTSQFSISIGGGGNGISIGGGRSRSGRRGRCQRGGRCRGDRPRRRRGGVSVGITITPGERRPPRRTRPQRPTRQVACSGGRTIKRGTVCVCPRGKKRRRISRRVYRCVGKPVRVVTPGPKLVCRNGRVRGTRCICAKSRRRVQLRRGVYACNRVRPPVKIAKPVKPRRPVKPPRKIAKPPKRARPTPRRKIAKPRRRIAKPPVRVARPPRRVTPPRALPPRPVAPIQNAALNVPEYIADEVLVSLPLTTAQAVDTELATRFGLEVIERQSLTLINARIVRYRIPDRRSVPDVVAALRADPRVAEPQPNYVYYKQAGGAGRPQFPLQYALMKLGAPDAHVIAKGTGALVAVIDSGIDDTHADLKGRIATGYDAVAQDKRASKSAKKLVDSHGTSVAGIIAADGVTTGIAPSSRLLNVRAFASGKSGTTPLATTARILKGLDWSMAERARILNMSFVGPMDGYMGRAVTAAQKQGAIIVAAAGNNGP
ncbi:MAG: S8 family serine peptidase, partial [Pseudomonadota bacterium]